MYEKVKSVPICSDNRYSGTLFFRHQKEKQGDFSPCSLLIQQLFLFQQPAWNIPYSIKGKHFCTLQKPFNSDCWKMCAMN